MDTNLIMFVRYVGETLATGLCDDPGLIAEIEYKLGDAVVAMASADEMLILDTLVDELVAMRKEVTSQ